MSTDRIMQEHIRVLKDGNRTIRELITVMNKGIRVLDQTLKYEVEKNRSTNFDSNHDDFLTIGPECFTDGLVISYKGDNYYKACDVYVKEHDDGGISYCVKRVDHPGNTHESYDGEIRTETQ